MTRPETVKMPLRSYSQHARQSTEPDISVTEVFYVLSIRGVKSFPPFSLIGRGVNLVFGHVCMV